MNLAIFALTTLLSAPTDLQPEAPLVLRPITKLGAGAGKEISGIVRSRRQPGVYWTLNDSGDEPRVYPIGIDGAVKASVRYPDVPGVLVGGAINSDWEDLAVDASGRLIIADLGNNTNARRDLTLYVIQEPEADEGRIGLSSRIQVRYPDQTAFPAPETDRNFDSEAIFTIGDEIYILSKDRSDTFTKLYRVDAKPQGEVTTLTYLDRFDVGGQATGADASEDGLKLVILTYDRIWCFERDDVRAPFFAGRVTMAPYTLHDGKSDSESICFETASTILVADEARGEMYRVPLADLREVAPGRKIPAGAADLDLKVMSFNLRYDTAADGANAWSKRTALVKVVIDASAPDLFGAQEALASQADWLRETYTNYGFCGVGRADGARGGEFSPILYNADRFTLLASGCFWLSETPDVPGSKGWDGACERLATWARLYDTRAKRPVLYLNTHLDHVGQQARKQGLELIRKRIETLAEGAAVIVTGDFNTSADGPAAPLLLGPETSGGSGLRLSDTFRAVYPARDLDEATFSGWHGTIAGDRIDWILASDQWFTIDAAIERRMTTGRTASDHYPVTATVRYRP